MARGVLAWQKGAGETLQQIAWIGNAPVWLFVLFCVLCYPLMRLLLPSAGVHWHAFTQRVLPTSLSIFLSWLCSNEIRREQKKKLLQIASWRAASATSRPSD